MDIQAYKNKIKRVSDKRNIQVTNSYGNNDAFRDYCKTSSKDSRLSSSKYRAFINKVNSLISLELFDTGFIKLPVGLGSISIYAKERIPKLVDGKLVYNAPIDWDRTLEL
jgi:hypothetical protein